MLPVASSGRSRGEPSRPDGCPGALKVHAAADGGLVRIRVPGGGLSALQLRELATLARDLCDGGLELTSRANLQLRGIAEPDHAPLARRVAALGLLPSATHERVRNILASPMTGRDDRGLLDLRPLVADLDHALCAQPELADLPGRFLFALDDGRGDVADLEADVGALAVGPHRVALLLAGYDSGLRMSPGETVATMLAAARAFQDERTAQASTAWRIGELDDGVARITDRVRTTAVDRCPPERRVATPVHGSGRSVGPLVQRDGLTALGVAVPLGRLDATPAERLADAADDGGGEVRLTPWREVLVCDLPPDRAFFWSSALVACGLVVDPTSPWVGASACTGRPGCEKSLADVRSDAARTLHSATRFDAPGLPVHWVGCSRRCGRPRGRVVEVVATESGYDLSKDGRILATRQDLDRTAALVAEARRDS